MTAINFPNAPAVDDIHTVGSKSWKWDGVAWGLVPPTLTVTNTNSVTEGSINKYFTSARARSAISAGGDLSYDAGTGVMSYTKPTNLTQFTNDSGFITASAITGKENTSNKGAANGYAPLGADSKVPAANLPSYVDDVVEVADFASLPTTGEAGKIYVSLATNKQYRWSGTAYVELVASPGSTDAIPEGTSNLYFTNARAISAVAATYQPVDPDLTAIAGLAATSGLLRKTAANTWSLDTTAYQPVDADLTSIAGLTGTTGLLKKTAANTWSLDTGGYLPLTGGILTGSLIVPTVNSISVGTGIHNGAIHSVAIGYGAKTAVSAMADGNTAVGHNTLSNNHSGSGNSAFGAQALKGNTSGAMADNTGWSNSAFGHSALVKNSSGSNNVAVGVNALYENTLGSNSVAVGLNALYFNTTGSSNIAVGLNALYPNITGSNNIAVGNYALNLNTNGSTNTAVGNEAMYFNTTGTSNCAFGKNALAANTTGVNNTAVGTNALSTSNTYINTTGVGYYTFVTGNDQVQLGNSSTTTYVYGTVQNRSDIRDKADVRNTVLGLDFINALRPVDYKFDMREDYKGTLPEQPSVSPPQSLPENTTAEQQLAYDAELAICTKAQDDYKAAIAAYSEANKLGNLTHDGSKKRSRYHHGLIAQEVQELIESTGVDFGGFQDHSKSGGEDVLSIGYDELIAPLIKSIQQLTDRLAQAEATIESLKA